MNGEEYPTRMSIIFIMCTNSNPVIALSGLSHSCTRKAKLPDKEPGAFGIQVKVKAVELQECG